MTIRSTRTAPLQRPADMTNQITNPDDLEVGRWYAIGFANEDNVIEWWKAPLCRYEGNGEWTAEDNEDYTDPVFTRQGRRQQEAEHMNTTVYLKARRQSIDEFINT